MLRCARIKIPLRGRHDEGIVPSTYGAKKELPHKKPDALRRIRFLTLFYEHVLRRRQFAQSPQQRCLFRLTARTAKKIHAPKSARTSSVIHIGYTSCSRRNTTNAIIHATPHCHKTTRPARSHERSSAAIVEIAATQGV